jgi:hypothetical protein
MKTPTQILSELLRDSGATLQFGLRAQGHIPTVNFMLAMGATWDDIGSAIGWQGKAVKIFYQEFECGPKETPAGG